MRSTDAKYCMGAIRIVLSLAGGSAPSAAPSAADKAKIAETIRALPAQTQTACNAHDAARNVAHDATEIVNMNHGQPNLAGPAAARMAV
jgi:hypothetical protein